MQGGARIKPTDECYACMYHVCFFPLKRPLQRNPSWKENHPMVYANDVAANAMRCDAMRCDAMRCDAMRCDAIRCDTMQTEHPNDTHKTPTMNPNPSRRQSFRYIIDSQKSNPDLRSHRTLQRALATLLSLPRSAVPPSTNQSGLKISPIVAFSTTSSLDI